MVILALSAIFAPGLALGAWLGWRAAAARTVRRGASLAWAGTTLWGIAVWTGLYLLVPAPHVAGYVEELGAALFRLASVAAVNALPAFAAGWLLATRTRNGAGG